MEYDQHKVCQYYLLGRMIISNTYANHNKEYTGGKPTVDTKLFIFHCITCSTIVN